jgi:hypothetical protein
MMQALAHHGGLRLFGRLLMSAPLEPGDLPARNHAPLRGAGL